MTDEEKKKYMEQIQDVLLDLQLEGKIHIEEITEEAGDNGEQITTIRIQPVLKTQEEVEEFLQRVKALGYMSDEEHNSEE
jgi:hypothetical protein